MSRLIKGLQTLGFVSIKEDEKKPAAPTPPPQSFSNPSVGVFTRPAAPLISAPSMTPEMAQKLADLDNHAKDRLLKVLANDGAPLCEELSETVETLEDAIPDEAGRYRAAIKLMAKKGHSKEAIVENYNKCLTALAADATTFNTETEEAVQRKVGSRQQQLTSLEGQIKSRQEQIEVLQKEILSIQTQCEAERLAIGDEAQKITLVRDRFFALYNVVRAEIEDQQKKVSATV